MKRMDHIKGEKFGTCRLCLNERKLCGSHIIPEFAFAGMYDEKNTFIAASVAQVKILQRPQKAWREYLLCTDCEKHLNDNFELPFKRYWVDGDALSPLVSQPLITLTDVDYGRFKLFHLSVLWRASVCTLDDFQVVDLGSHNETIRRMILENDPGPPSAYPIVCYGIVHEDRICQNIASDPLKAELQGYDGYTFRFCGCQWLYFVPSNSAPVMERIRLSEDGILHVAAVRLEEIIARDIGKARAHG